MYTKRVAYTNRWAPGPGPVGDVEAGGGPGVVVSCRGHQPEPVVIAQARVHPTNVEWLPVGGAIAHGDGHGNTIVTCPVHGPITLTSQEVARASNRVKRRWRSVGIYVRPGA